MSELGRTAEEAAALALAVPPAQGATMRGVPFEPR